MKIQKKNPSLLKDYRKANTVCEVTPHLEGKEWEHHQWLSRAQAPKERDQLELHHIWAGHKSRFDVVPNIIMISNLAHRFLQGNHDWNLLVCTFVKVQKGEFDREVMRYVAGKDVIGVIEYIECYGIEWLDNLKLYILESA